MSEELYRRLVVQIGLLDWNRGLSEPLIKVGYEYGVADKVIDLLTTCGTFCKNDCVSSEDLCKLLKPKEE